MTFDVRTVPWDDPVAVALREAMEAEARLLDPDRRDPPHDLVDDAVTVAYTAVAYNGQGLPVGHVALHWYWPGVLELTWMYVMPAYRGRGVTLPLFDAAHRAAAELGAERVVSRAGHGRPDAA